MLWHRYNKSPIQKKAENSELTKSLERIVGFILNGDNPKNLAEVIHDNDINKSYFFNGEFNEEKKEYVKSLKDSLDRVYNQDKIQKNGKKRPLVTSALLYIALFGLGTFGAGIGANKYLPKYINNYLQKLNNTALLQKKGNDEQRKINVQQEAKKAEETKRLNEEKEKSLKLEQQKQIDLQKAEKQRIEQEKQAKIKTEQEKLKQEAEQKKLKAEQEKQARIKSEEEKKKAVEKRNHAIISLQADREYLSDLEKTLEESGGVEIFNTDKVLSGKQAIKFKLNEAAKKYELEIAEGGDVGFYTLEEGEHQKVNQLREKHILKYLK